MNYQKALELINNKRGGSVPGSVKVAHNTRIRLCDDGRIALKLHETDVLVFRPDGSVQVDTGGWRTVTTKQRINHFLPAGSPHVYSVKGEWTWSHWEWPFENHDTITADGRIVRNDQI